MITITITITTAITTSQIPNENQPTLFTVRSLNPGHNQGWLRSWRTRPSRVRLRLRTEKHIYRCCRTLLSRVTSFKASYRGSLELFPFRTMDNRIRTAHDTNDNSSCIPWWDLHIQYVIRLLRGDAKTTYNNATYNLEEKFKNNIFKIWL